MSDAINFRAGRAWRWHGDVTSDAMFAGHWADEPCDECRRLDALPPTLRVSAVDRDLGTITFESIEEDSER